MNKPNDWENVSAYGEFKPLPAGGYVCKVWKVEECASKNGAPMLKIYLDICEGEHSGYFTELYKSDTRQDKKWGCVYYQLTQDYQDSSKTNRGFKTFVTSVEESNAGFSVQWGAKFAACFAGKAVGCIFRKEQYMGTDGKYYWNTKPWQFRSIDTIRKGVDVPEDKYTDAPEGAPSTPRNAYSSGGNAYSSGGNAYSASGNASADPFAAAQNNSTPAQNNSGGLSDFTEVISEGDLPF